MGPEVRFKSARRCQGTQKHQGNHHIIASIGNQQSFWAFHTFFQFLGFLNWELFIRYAGTQTLCTHKLFSRTLLFICSCQRSSRASNSSISSYFFTSSSINSSPSASPSSFYLHFRTQAPILYRLTKRKSDDSQRSSDAPFFHHRDCRR